PGKCSVLVYPIRVQTHYYICRNLQIIFILAGRSTFASFARFLLLVTLSCCFFVLSLPYRQPLLVLPLPPRPHRPRSLGSNALLVVMSLNGLDNPDVLEAYQSALTEAGGW